MILSFKQKFNQAIIEGSKIHTIREGERWRSGLMIQFYNNTRTKYIEKFTDDKKCIAVQKIQIYHSNELPGLRWISIEGKELTSSLKIETLAKNDGFNSADEFFAFFFTNRECTLFEGQIIHWTNYLY